MGSHNNPPVNLQAILFSSGLIRRIFCRLSTSFFSLESKGSISDNLPILLCRICYGQVLILTLLDTIKSLYQGSLISIYQNMDILIYTGIPPIGYIAHRLFRYRVDYICNRLFSLPIGLLTVFRYRYRNTKPYYAPNTSPLSEQRRAGACGEQSPFMEHLCWKPPLDGRISIALSLTLAGQKGPIFPKKIGASGGWAEPHLLAFTVP